MEEKKVWQSAGGKATAIKLRREALDKYYKNPNRCLYCGKVIMVKENQQVSVARLKKFCNRTCSGLYNNRLRPKKLISGSICKKCNKHFEYKNRTYYKRRLCDDCKSGNYERFIGDKTSKCKSCGKEIQCTKIKDRYNVYRAIKTCDECKGKNKIDNKTKGECFENKKYWQMARSQITKNARKIYIFNNGERKCFVCGYNTYVEICHKKAVKDFEDSVTIREINDINNLVALCPNHHKELDLGLLKLDKDINAALA